MPLLPLSLTLFKHNGIQEQCKHNIFLIFLAKMSPSDKMSIDFHRQPWKFSKKKYYYFFFTSCSHRQ